MKPFVESVGEANHKVPGKHLPAMRVTAELKVKAMNLSLPTAVRGERSNLKRLVIGCMDSYDSEQRRNFQH